MNRKHILIMAICVITIIVAVLAIWKLVISNKQDANDSTTINSVVSNDIKNSAKILVDFHVNTKVDITDKNDIAELVKMFTSSDSIKEDYKSGIKGHTYVLSFMDKDDNVIQEITVIDDGVIRIDESVYAVQEVKVSTIDEISGINRARQ